MVKWIQEMKQYSWRASLTIPENSFPQSDPIPFTGQFASDSTPYQTELSAQTFLGGDSGGPHRDATTAFTSVILL